MKNESQYGLLLLQRYLYEHTDDQHPASVADILAFWREHGIQAGRKSVYSAIEVLQSNGMDIVCVKSTQNRYFVGERLFELPELKLLVDAVQASRFITTKKSRSLIKKLEKLAGKQDAGKLQRQVYVAGRVKTENESIYYNIDTIHRAIQENRQIAFLYMDWNLKKEMTARPGGIRKVSPWALIWQDENYYLAAYDEADDMLKHYRVDKMGQAEVLTEARKGTEKFAGIDPAVYTNRTFGMFGGEETVVTLQFPNRLIGVVMDRFGKEADIRPVTERVFRVRASVAVSGQFFGWLAGIGREAVIISPEPVRERYRVWLEDIVATMRMTEALSEK